MPLSCSSIRDYCMTHPTNGCNHTPTMQHPRQDTRTMWCIACAQAPAHTWHLAQRLHECAKGCHPSRYYYSEPALFPLLSILVLCPLQWKFQILQLCRLQLAKVESGSANVAVLQETVLQAEFPTWSNDMRIRASGAVGHPQDG